MSLAPSFANLVKTNNGLFKSAAQAQYLLSQCRDGEYVAMGSAYGHGFTLFYTCDAKGVVKVSKQTVGKGLVTQWERAEAGKVSIQDEKEIKRLKRLIKQTEKSLAERQASKDAGEYPNEALFSEAQGRDQASLVELNSMLAKLVA